MMRLVLVSCSAKKKLHGCEARDLYVSPLFQMARGYAQRAGCPWAILSAKYGMLWPTQVVEPYDRHLASLSKAARLRWGKDVALVIGQAPPSGGVMEVHAGQRYVDALRGPVTGRGWRLETPLKGLQIGERLHWYTLRAEEARLRQQAPDWTAYTETVGAIVCPHCGHRDRDHHAHGVPMPMGAVETACVACGKRFRVEGEATFTFTSSPIRAKRAV